MLFTVKLRHCERMRSKSEFWWVHMCSIWANHSSVRSLWLVKKKQQADEKCFFDQSHLSWSNM